MHRRMLVCLMTLALLCASLPAAADLYQFVPYDDMPTLPPPGAPTRTPTPAPTVAPTPEPPTAYTLGVAAFPEESGEKRKVLLSFLGDCTLGMNEIDHGKKKSLDYFIGQYGYGYCFDRVRYILEQDELTVGNLECVLADTADGLDAQTKKTYNFRAYESYVGILEQGSVEAVTVANNHIGDYGRPGFDATARVLDASRVRWFGSTDYGGRACIYETGGIRVGFVGSHVAYYWQHVEEMQALFDELRAEGCQAIIGVIHAGVEYDKRHDYNQVKIARRFIEWGADIVVGHHPHVLQGYEVMDGVPVYYSLGNFVFAGNFQVKTRYTAILQLALSFSEDGRYLGSRANFIPCRLSEHSEINYYQPYPVTGREAGLAIRQIQYDTKDPWRIRDYVENIGAMQDFVPAVEH